jgi:hypothetical protein
MITVKTIGFQNGQMPKDYSVEEGSTVGGLATQMGIQNPNSVAWRLGSEPVGVSTPLYDRAVVSYVMRDIKGA